jgi:hypothetical protein
MRSSKEGRQRSRRCRQEGSNQAPQRGGKGKRRPTREAAVLEMDRVGERVLTQDGFFAKIVGVSCEGPLLLDL